jgi:hypothetical protein
MTCMLSNAFRIASRYIRQECSISCATAVCILSVGRHANWASKWATFTLGLTMIRTLKIDDINPRDDADYVLNKVREFLNSCDPHTTRPDLKIKSAEK